MGSRLRSLAVRSVLFGAGAYLTTNYIGSFNIVIGPSMEPTIESGSILLTERITPARKKVEVGDIVIAQNPVEEGCYVCKRVAGKGGDLVQWERNRAWIHVPPGHLWLLGDNPGNSKDSRRYGPVHEDAVTARCFCRLYPQPTFSLDKRGERVGEGNKEKWWTKVTDNT